MIFPYNFTCPDFVVSMRHSGSYFSWGIPPYSSLIALPPKSGWLYYSHSIIKVNLTKVMMNDDYVSTNIFGCLWNEISLISSKFVIMRLSLDVINLCLAGQASSFSCPKFTMHCHNFMNGVWYFYLLPSTITLKRNEWVLVYKLFWNQSINLINRHKVTWSLSN